MKHLHALLLIVSSCLTAHAQTEIDFAEAARRGPGVASILEMERDTPAQQLQAVLLLLDLGEEDVAEALWKEFSAQEVDDETKAALVREFGAARFLQLGRTETSDAFAGTRAFAESALIASSQARSAPKRLAELIEQLTDASAAVQQAARNDLAVTGDAGAIACLSALAKADDSDRGKTLRAQLLLTLAKMRPGVEPLLIAALAEGQGQFRRDVVELAGYLHMQDAVPWLAALAAGADADPRVATAAHAALAKMGLSTPSAADAQAVIRGEIRRLEARKYPTDTESPQWWTYDAEKKTLTAQQVTPDVKHQLKLARLARALSLVPGASPGDQRLALIHALQVSALLDQPVASNLQQWAESQSIAELSEMLREAMEGDQVAAAIATAKLLGNRADAAALISLGGQRSPLAQALGHANRELRFAALEAVMKMKPVQSFAGASAVPTALWEFAASAGKPQAIAAAPVVTRASDWAGRLRGLGYDATPVTTGRAAMRLALDLPRLEVILVDSDIGRPLVREVLYSLRSVPRTARVPIAILSSSHQLPRMETIAEPDPYSLATPRPHGEGSMQGVLSRLAALAPNRPSAERRTEQAQAALGWLGDLLAGENPYDELLRGGGLMSQTLYEPALTDASLRVLGLLGTASSQRLLLDYISAPTLSIESRRQARDAFAASVQRFGKLLSSEELLRQYDRYNASETADRETQELLGGVLDILEKQK